MEEEFAGLSLNSRIGYLYDESLLLHKEDATSWNEIPERILTIHNDFNKEDLISRCVTIPFDPATPEQVARVHVSSLVDKLVNMRECEYPNIFDAEPRQAGTKYSFGQETDLWDNEYTSDCIFKSCGGVIKAVESVWRGEVHQAFANVRPPGHHSNSEFPAGFCFVNNVAVAAKFATEELGARRVLIFDWDVHHGNGTQDIFESNDNIMFISIHRFDHGSFYPFLPEKGIGTFTAPGDHKPFSYNIAWNCEGIKEQSNIGDGDYKLAFDNIVEPVIQQFNPDVIIVSAGFDAMEGDPLGKLSNTGAIYAYMTHKLLEYAK